jgi:serine/threonine protein kinase
METRPEVADARERRFNEVLGAYLEAADAGWAPDRKALMTSYPDLAPRLKAFFAAQSRVAGLVYPCHASTQKPATDADGNEDDLDLATVAHGHEPKVGDHVGDYLLVDLIKEGGQGKVFKARQETANLVVALKMIKKGRLATAQVVRAFLREADAVANLDHPHIVPIKYVGVHDGLPYFSMKLFECGSLQNQLPQFENDHRAAARLMVTVARAVQHAHERSLLHRDLKPCNILLDAKNQPYVADFGLAKFLRSAAATPTPGAAQFPETEAAQDEKVNRIPEPGGKTNGNGLGSKTHHGTATAATLETYSGAFVGTKGYAPPENTCVTRDSATVKADVFGLGAILYRMLTGKQVFDAEELDIWEYADKVCNLPVPAPRQKNSKVDAHLEAVCLKSLQTAPADRYATPADLADDLELWLAGKPPNAWKMPSWMRAWRAVRRHLLVATVAMGSGFALAALFFMLYWFDPDRVPRELEERAKRGHVTLIGATGPPVWSRWNLGDGTVMVSPEVDRAFSFTTADYGRLELLRKAPALPFRFSAEVKHDLAIKNQSFAGIYFAQNLVSTDTATVSYWCELSFTDVGLNAKEKGVVKLTRERHDFRAGLDARSTFATVAFHSFESAQAARRFPEWRKMEVKVTPQKVEAVWEQRALKPLLPADLSKEFYSISGGKVVTRDFNYAPDGALGLFVFGGKASFRNVIVELLD